MDKLQEFEKWKRSQADTPFLYHTGYLGADAERPAATALRELRRAVYALYKKAGAFLYQRRDGEQSQYFVKKRKTK